MSIIRSMNPAQRRVSCRRNHLRSIRCLLRYGVWLIRSHRMRASLLCLCVGLAGGSAFAQDGVEQGRRLNVFAKHRSEAQYKEAEKLARQTLAEVERNSPVGTSMAVPAWLSNVALAMHEQGRYVEAEAEYLRAYNMARTFWRGEHHEMTRYMENLARLYIDLTRFREAEDYLRRVLKLRETWNRPDHGDIANALNLLGIICLELEKITEAETLHRRALQIREDLWGPLHDDVAMSLGNLGSVLEAQGKYLDAEASHKKAISLSEQIHGGEHIEVCHALSHLGVLYFNIGRYDDAASLIRRAIAIRERYLRPNHPQLAMSYANLALVFEHQGKYIEADQLQRRALDIRKEALSENHLDLASSFHSLASLYESHGRNSEAVDYLQKALKIRQDVLGENHHLVADSLNNLAIIYGRVGVPAEEEKYYRRALNAREQAKGKGDPKLAGLLHNFAEMYLGRGQPDLAEPLQREALRIQEQNFSPTYHGLGLTLAGLAETAIAKNQMAEALTLLNRAIQLQENGGASPADLARDYLARAQLHWRIKKIPEALADGNTAMRFAEQQRLQAAGAEFDRSRLFSKSRNAFHQVVAWQTELGNVSEAFAAMERFRARSLLDQLEHQGVELLSGVPSDQARKLRRREAIAQTRVASVLQKINHANRLPPAPPGDEKAGVDALQVDLAKAQLELINVDRDIRTSSSAYQLAIGKEFQPVSLKDMQIWLTSESALLLEYLLTPSGSWLFVVPATGEPKVVPLVINESQASALGIPAGPLTASRLSAAMQVENQSLLKLLSSTERNEALLRRLHLLWTLLIPESERELLVNGSLKKLVVVPDGELSQLPFAILAVDSNDSPQFLLDVGPPIVSAPSATVLINLLQRPALTIKSDRKSVLSVGDPIYEVPETKPVSGQSALASATEAYYRTAGGRLTRLPFTAQETEWVTSAFSEAGIAADKLLAHSATEQNVRQNVDGRRIIHLACHGLVDQQHGNFFGSLALTPAPPDSRKADNDGFLTLPEICDLSLRHCDLALLSACHTNVGPYQSGEGIWGLSRGFLVAGARRVVASNWLVDDEAAATLVSLFTSQIARSHGKLTPLDHASFLQRAQRAIRAESKWSHPGFWGTFVLIGPP